LPYWRLTLSDTPNKVSTLGPPKRLLPDMQIRWLMANMDKVRSLAVVVDMVDSHPSVSISSNCTPYFLSLGSDILARESMTRLPSSK
jgi:hypothetical protein